MDIKQTADDMGALWYKELDNKEIAYIVPLAFHVAVYIYPQDAGDWAEFKDRYCMHGIELAKMAIGEYNETGEMKYWQKHHNKEISIVGNKAYRSGEQEIEANILFEVPWNMVEVQEQWEHYISPQVLAMGLP